MRSKCSNLRELNWLNMNETKKYDIAVVGAGPAGALLCSLLSKNYSVIVFDRQGEGSNFEKPCGGLLSEAAQEAFAKLSINIPEEILTTPQIYSVRTLDVESGDERSYFKGYVNMDRNKFNAFMQGLIPQEVTFVKNCRVLNVERDTEGFKLSYKKGDGKHDIACKLLVGADGANSLVRRKLFPNHRIRSYTAIQQWFIDKNPAPFYSAIFDPVTSGACSWTIHKNGYFIFGGAFEHDSSRDRFEAQKKRLNDRFGIRFGEPVKTEACIVLRPRSSREVLCGENGCFLIGEAAGYISPSSFEGISFALYSANALANAANAVNELITLTPSPVLRAQAKERIMRDYVSGTAFLRRKIDARVVKGYFMFTPALRRVALKSGLMGLKKERKK